MRRSLLIVAVLGGCARPPARPVLVEARSARIEARARDAAAYESCSTACTRLGVTPVWPDWLEPYITRYAFRLKTLECKVECLKQRAWRTKNHLATVDTSPL